MSVGDISQSVGCKKKFFKLGFWNLYVGHFVFKFDEVFSVIKKLNIVLNCIYIGIVINFINKFILFVHKFLLLNIINEWRRKLTSIVN